MHLASGPLIAMVILLICLGGIEMTGYFWEQKTVQGPLGWTLVAARRLHLEARGTVDQPYYVFRPNDDYLWQSIPVHINSRGFRTREFAVPKPPATYRILNVGDSVAFGWEVNQQDTYGARLEGLLNTPSRGKNYEVINAAIPGWGPQDEKSFVLEEGMSYQPDLVILDVTVVNDISQLTGLGGDPVAEKKQGLFQWLRDNTYGWPFLTIQARFLLSGVNGPEAIPVLNPPRQASEYYPLDASSPIYDRLWSEYKILGELFKQRRIPFVIVAFPTAFQVNGAGHPDVPQQVLGERAKAAGITFVDLLPVYKQWCGANGVELCEGYQNSLFVDVWMHPNQTGHRIAAEQILNALPK